MHPRLSARQEQCLRLTAFRTDKEIAAHLGISEATVKKHVHEACQRLGVNRRKAALARLDASTADTGATSDRVGALANDGPHAAALALSGNGPAAGPGAGARLGYRAPPRNTALRIALMAGLAVIMAALVATTVVMLSEMHEAVGKIDARVYPGVAGKTS